MEIIEKIELDIIIFEDEIENLKAELSASKEKNKSYDVHYKIREREKEIEKLIYGLECKVEFIKSLKINR